MNKRLLADSVFPALFDQLPARFWQRILRVPVLLPYYHVVSDAEVPHIKHLYRHRRIAEFKAHLDFFLRDFSPIGLPDLIQHLKQGQSLPPRPFLLTFDDGFREMHDVVAPILRAKGVPAVFFLTSGFLDNRALCHNELASLLIERITTSSGKLPLAEIDAALDAAGVAQGSLPARLLKVTYLQRGALGKIAPLMDFDVSDYLKTTQPYLTTNQVESLIKDSFAIGAHSVDHPHYKLLCLDEQLHQTRESLRVIKERFRLKYSALAFPHSDTGVSRRFFDTLHSNHELDVSFGTKGMIEDESPFHFQRFTMEKTTRPASRVLAREYSRKFANILVGRRAFKRPA